MLLDRLQELAKQEDLSDKYLVELFYEDYEKWYETAKFTSATDAFNFLKCHLLADTESTKTRISDIETNEIVYEFDANEFRDELVSNWKKDSRSRGAENADD